jgi:hypothetical protein
MNKRRMILRCTWNHLASAPSSISTGEIPKSISTEEIPKYINIIILLIPELADEGDPDRQRGGWGTET